MGLDYEPEEGRLQPRVSEDYHRFERSIQMKCEMSITSNKLIGMDGMEASILRQKLYPWDPTQPRTYRPVKSLINKVLEECEKRHELKEPRWETNVFPLYYYY